MASVFRYLQRQAHENPVYFYSIVLGSVGPVLAVTVPPARRRFFGYERPEYIPTSYPVPNRTRTPVSSEFDDPPEDPNLLALKQGKL